MSEATEYAIPLFSLVDASKVDPGQSLPDELGEQLGIYLDKQFGIESLSTRLIVLEDTPYLVLHGVDNKSLPALCSLVDVQRTQLFRYERTDEQMVTLTPLNVRIED